MRSIAMIILICATISACSSYQGAQLQAGIDKAKYECGETTFPTESAVIRCQDNKESQVWLTYAPDYFSYFQEIKRVRDQLSAQYDVGEITAQQMKTNYYKEQNQIMARMNSQVIASQIAEKQANDQFAQNLGEALQAAAVAQATRPLPQSETTDCTRFGDLIHCNTFSY